MRKGVSYIRNPLCEFSLSIRIERPNFRKGTGREVSRFTAISATRPKCPPRPIAQNIATVHLVFNLYNVAQRKVVQSVAEKAFYERHREKYLYRDGFARALLLHFSREQLVLPLEHVVLFA